MSRLIVISNRVQAPQPGTGGGAQGGLAVALNAALAEEDGIWFGWSGETSDNRELRFQTYGGVTSAVMDLSEQDVEEYYDGYANRTLWPLFHYRLDLTEFERDFQGGYERVNRVFGERIGPHVEPDDLIWVHDYHMIPLGWVLRQQGITNRIGFFLHIPWPPRRLLTALPDHRRMVEALFAYDVVGFQNEEWLDSFFNYVREEMDGTIDGNRVTVGGRTICAISCPIGIEAKDFIAGASGPVARAAQLNQLESAVGRSLIVGVDRLDYSKGLPERFAGYERFLQNHPDRRALVYLLQIAPPSRTAVQTYRDIRNTLEQQSGRINGAYADTDWVPIRYVNKGYPREVLAGIYRAARIGLVTPLRDGMNLVAKEYVAAQDPRDPGVLVLSRFAGAAQQLSVGALMVNPYSAEDVADAIDKALRMPRAERIERWQAMIDNVVDEDVIWWRKRFIDALTAETNDA
ncbi:alpha,alpha-trehalose-phosphate synthase [Sphingomonas sp. Leaf24]|uniref:alpha,alpha-trehalose-phosphate synthase (UDP-forming) n=1 Tax=unclassified Sphingomonas TaxID=196159 RepID=UPI0006F7B886|nr:MULTISPECIES: trehalose-6-phosphate synthase [unclassified Sphingomonas]KQM23048.1 alpha,alpha-trehalose-phosphate synthase [Sphingomonas sp. Leaf5]KQM95906.1 alpha,alpha-trehalose-phosphate synthase [Sphingomonas sp. Leaf24]